MKIAKTRTFTHDVKVFTPVDEGSREETLRTTFNYLGVEEVAKFDLATREGTTKCLNAIVAKFHDLTDEADKPLACTPALRDALLNLQHVRQALATHYFEAVGKVKAGN
jgi:hypothetical protein